MTMTNNQGMTTFRTSSGSNSEANEIWMRFAFLSRSDSGSVTSWLIDARSATLECGSTLTGVATE